MSCFQKQSNTVTLLSRVRSTKNILPPVEEIEQSLAQKTAQMLQFEKEGHYAEASSCKESVDSLKKDLQQKKLLDLVNKQKSQQKDIEKHQQQTFTELEESWNKKIAQQNSEAERSFKQMDERHQNELKNAKIEIEASIPKFKESSQCLNLRKIEEQNAKQKNYAEAHQIQLKVAELEKKEKQKYAEQRQAKIETGLEIFKNKQRLEKQALLKKINLSQNEIQAQKEVELTQLKMKNENILKQLKSQQQKQVLAISGQLKSRVSVSGAKSPSKNTFNSTH